MKEIFLSYASVEIDVARDICNLAENNQIGCFLAERDIRPGQEYAGEIIEGLDEATVMLLLLSRASNESPHVLREVEYAVSHHKKVLVYQLEDVQLSKSMEYFLMACQWIVLGEDQKGRLVKALEEIVPSSERQVVKKQESEDDIRKELARTNKRLQRVMIAAGVIIALLVAALVLMFVGYGRDAKETVKEENVTQYAVGDTVVFGSYNEEPIEWRVIRLNEDGTAVLVAKNILTIKAFDTAEGGEYNEYEGVDYYSFENHIVTDDNLNVLIRGNNEWRISNIRTWLNSDKEMVDYEDQAPTRKATCGSVNDYSEEPGFLYAFTEEEKGALVLTKNLTKPNRLSEEVNADGMVESEDYVYLLSADEIEWIKEAGISHYAKVTDAAFAKDESNNVEYYQDKYESYWYWTRDPNTDTVERGVLVNLNMGEDELFDTDETVGAACYGIRPAVTVDLSAL